MKSISCFYFPSKWDDFLVSTDVALSYAVIDRRGCQRRLYLQKGQFNCKGSGGPGGWFQTCKNTLRACTTTHMWLQLDDNANMARGRSAHDYNALHANNPLADDENCISSQSSSNTSSWSWIGYRYQICGLTVNLTLITLLSDNEFDK